MLVCCVCGGCHGTQPAITAAALAGSYKYVSEDPASRAADHALDHLVLNADGSYDLVEGGTTKTRTETVGKWTMWNGGHNGPEALLGHSGFPIEIKKGDVRLLVDNDVGIWWEKTD